MRRELTIALRAPVTWVVASLSALLIGHGFVLAVDLFSASSRSALMSQLQVREMDPLAGIVRPTLGGLDLAISILVPLVAVRALAAEKERRTFGALCLEVGSPRLVIWRKFLASCVATAPVLACPVLLWATFGTVGGSLDPIESGVALLGEGLHLLLAVAIGTLAAAWTRTLAQAATLALLLSLSSWAIDASEGFAALAWLGGASSWSVERLLAPFQRGVLSLGSLVWLFAVIGGALALAFVGGMFRVSARERLLRAAAVGVVTALCLSWAASYRRAYDWSEARRQSLPPAAVTGLRALGEPIAIELFLDRDDSRRRQLESDVIAKLRLARPDIAIHAPLDQDSTRAVAQRDVGYGRIVLRVGAQTRETRSTSRREILTLIFEAAGRSLPDWTQPSYAGHPSVIEGSKRNLLLIVAYAGLPGALLAMGFLLTRTRIMR
jgi:ABC-2 type transport system permease protein